MAMLTTQGSGRPGRARSGGVVLPLALVFLTLLMLLAAALGRSSLLELRLSTNTEAREFARQQAQGVVTALSTGPGYFPLLSRPGYIRCDALSHCDDASLSLPEAVVAGAGPAGATQPRPAYYLRRLGPAV
ncbi:MAG: hypothetical protein ACK5HY_12700, partial [Parahaliea sp.]